MARANRTTGGGGTRISSGRLRGRVLRVAPGVRPTESRLREALFSIWGPRVRESRFLDLFAGSGAVGLEALSRGAAEVWLVEGDPRVARVLASNLERVGVERRRLVRAELPAGLARVAGSTFDLIFADPPYAFEAYLEVLERAAPLLAEGGSLALEHARRLELPISVSILELEDRRTYGDKALSFYRR